VLYDTYQEFFIKEGLKGLKVDGVGQIVSDDRINLVEVLSDKEKVRSAFKEFCDYGKLSKVGQGETDVQGLKIEVEGDGSWRGKDYYSVNLVDAGQTLRVFKDNTITFWYANDWFSLDLDARNNPELKVHNTQLTTILDKGCIDESGLFTTLEKGKGVELFGAKGVVTDAGDTPKGSYATIEIKQADGKARHIKVTWDGLTIVEFEKRVIGFEAGEDGSVKLLYDAGTAVQGTLIKSPSLTITPHQVDVFVNRIKSDTTTNAIWDKIQSNTKFSIIQNIGINSLKEFAEQLAYAVSPENDFIATYGNDAYNALTAIGNDVLKWETENGCEALGLKGFEVTIEGGVKPHKTGPDAIVWKDGKELFKVEFKTTGEDCNGRLTDIRAAFNKDKAQLGLIIGTDGIEIYENKPIMDRVLGRVSQSKLDQFYGAFLIPGLGLISGFFTGANEKAVNITDDTGRWIGEFHDLYLDHTVVNGSTVFNSSLTLSSVEGSYLQNVRSSGSTISGSVITDSNVSAKLILNSILQNTLAVCSTIANSVIDSCRILNSTLVNVVNLVKSYIEDTFLTNSADISNCTIRASNLMSVVNLNNTSITGSNLTLVANVDHTKIDHSDISYSANISSSVITDTKLMGCTIQESKLTSCTAVNSILENVEATSAHLTGTTTEYSTLKGVNATNSKLTNTNAEYSNLVNVQLKNVNVIGTDLTNMVLVDRTVMYGRMIDSNENIIDPFRKVGTPNYSGKSVSSSASITTSNALSGKASTTTTPVKTSSSSSQTQIAAPTSSNTPTKSSQATASPQTTASLPIADKPISRGANIWIN